MGMTNKEKQKEFRQRMFDAGYKGKLVWVLRDSDGSQTSGKRTPKMDRKTFIRKVDELTVALSPTQLSKVLKEAIGFIKERTAK